MNKEAKELARIERQIADEEFQAATLEEEIVSLDGVAKAEKEVELQRVVTRLTRLHRQYEELDSLLYEDQYDESW